MNQITFNSVVKVICVNNLAVQERTLGPPNLSAALLVNEQPGAQLLWLDLKESSELLKIHCSVELEVRLHCGVEECVLDLIHEDGSVVVDGVDVELWVIEIRWGGVDELGAGRAEELLEEREGLGTATLEAEELLAVLLTESRVDSVVQASRVEGGADGDQSQHLIVLLGDGIVAVVALLEVLCSGNIDENVAEHANGIGVTAHHHVGETNIVVGCEMRGHDTGEHGLLVQLDIIESLESKTEIAEEDVDAKKSDDGEVAKHMVKRSCAILSSDSGWVFTALDSCELFIDL